MKFLSRTCIVFIFIFAMSANCYAFRDISVVTTWSNLTLYKNLEKPFWSDILPKKTEGALNAKIVGSLDQLNTTGTGLLRQMENGIFDVVVVCTDYIVSDSPEMAGLDLPVLSPDIETARQVVDSFHPVLEDLFKENFNAKVLSICPYPQQVLFSNFPMEEGLNSLKGQKIRASGWTTAKFIDAAGGTGVTMSFGEVPQALSRGVVDGAITGSLSGYSANWYEVTKYLYPLPLGGWDYYVSVMNYDVWNQMKPEEQEMLQTNIKEYLEIPAWDVAEEETRKGVEILTATGDYKGQEAFMELIEVTKNDIEQSRQILEKDILPAYGNEISADMASRWNETIGSVTGLEIR